MFAHVALFSFYNVDKIIIINNNKNEFHSVHRVKHLILADPWGFQEKPKEIAAPLWIRAIAYMVSPLNPLWALRAAGPYGQWVVQKTRPDLLRKFQDVVKSDDIPSGNENIDNNENIIAQYIHQCNAQTPT